MNQAVLREAINDYPPASSDQTSDLFAPRFVDVGGLAVRYVRQARENSPALVLLNGFPQSIRMWETFWPALSKEFDLLAFDIPGFGLSDAQETDMSPRQLSHCVIKVLDYFGIRKAHLVGPDVGVPITLATAIEYADRLESINIFDGPGSYPPDMAPILKAVINYPLVRWLAKGVTKKSVMKTNFLAATKDGYHVYRPTRTRYEEYHQITHDDRRHLCSVSFFGSYKKDLPWIHDRLDQIQIPTLITWGKLDPFVRVSNAHYLASRLPNNKLVVFENASHFSSEDAGDEYLDTIRDWCVDDYKHV